MIKNFTHRKRQALLPAAEGEKGGSGEERGKSAGMRAGAGKMRPAAAIGELLPPGMPARACGQRGRQSGKTRHEKVAGFTQKRRGVLRLEAGGGGAWGRARRGQRDFVTFL